MIKMSKSPRSRISAVIVKFVVDSGVLVSKLTPAFCGFEVSVRRITSKFPTTRRFIKKNYDLLLISLQNSGIESRVHNLIVKYNEVM